MGLIRGGLLTLVSILLFTSLFAGNFFLTFSWSLEYDVIKPELSSIISEMAETQMNITNVMDDQLAFMEPYCENNTEFVFSEQGYTFTIPCNIVSQGPESIINYGTDSFIEKVYYKDYDCNFWDCLKEVDSGQPFVLISEKAKNYWKNLFYISLVISIISIILMFILVTKKNDLFIIAGASLIVASLPFMKLEWFFSLLPQNYLIDVFSVFFTKSYNVFLMSFVIGLIVLAIGIAFKFWGLTDFISKKLMKKGEPIKQEKSAPVKQEKVSPSK